MHRKIFRTLYVFYLYIGISLIMGWMIIENLNKESMSSGLTVDLLIKLFVMLFLLNFLFLLENWFKEVKFKMLLFFCSMLISTFVIVAVYF